MLAMFMGRHVADIRYGRFKHLCNARASSEIELDGCWRRAERMQSSEHRGARARRGVAPTAAPERRISNQSGALQWPTLHLSMFRAGGPWGQRLLAPRLRPRRCPAWWPHSNPFEAHDIKVAKGERRLPFEVNELQAIFDALPVEIAPKRHSPESALPWAVRIAAYSGARLEEIAQLNTDDVREEEANGSRVWIFDIHN